MDELKLLIEMVANLPTLAVWVLVGFLCYKISVVGSIYGVIHLAIVKFHDWATRPPPPKVLTLRGKTISQDVADRLETAVTRIPGNKGLLYIHNDDVSALEEAIQLVLEKHRK